MSSKKMTGAKDRRRGIYILPNLFTSLNLFFGFYGMVSATRGQFQAAAVLIIIAVVFDMLDGKIARATRTTSRFGVEYDSLADLVSFGVAPALTVYLWALEPLGRMGWLAAFLFTICGALRLARFNVQAGASSGDHFTGLPIPAAAGMTATIILIWHRLGMAGSPHALPVLLVVYLLSFLMVSTIHYHSFKKPELFKKMNFNALVAAILVLIFIAAQPSIALFLFGVLYVASGPVMALRHARAGSKKNHPVSDADRPGRKTVE